jgi:hypothetical protein
LDAGAYKVYPAFKLVGIEVIGDQPYEFSIKDNSESEEPSTEPEGTGFLSSIDDYLTMDYDEENRLKSFKFDLGDDDDAVYWEFSYDPFTITDVTPGDEGLLSSFDLNGQGLVSNFQTKYDELAKVKVKYTSNNCLESFEESYTSGDYTNIYLEWENGNLMKITNIDYCKSESYNDKIICEFEYGDMANAHALPTLMNTMVSGGMNVWQYTGLFGQTISKDLPIAIKQSYYDNNELDGYDSYTVDYEIDENGYITKEKVGIEGYVIPFNYKYKSVGTRTVGISRKDVLRITKHMKHRIHIRRP